MPPPPVPDAIQLPSTSFLPLLQYGGLLLLILYSLLMKSCFNTLNPARARREEAERNKLEGRYRGLFDRRGALVDELGWAEMNGKGAVERGRIGDTIKGVDGEIDECEREIRRLYARHGVGKLGRAE